MEKIIFFSKNLKTYFFAYEKEIKSLADQLDLAPHTIRLWMAQNRPPDNFKLKALSEIIGVSADDLVNHDLTYRLIQMSNYSNIVADPGDTSYTENAVLSRYKNYIEKVNDGLTRLLKDGEKVLRG